MIETPELLRDLIKLTNNGYLFSPKEWQVRVAKENPRLFKYTYNPRNNVFPHKIENIE